MTNLQHKISPFWVLVFLFIAVTVFSGCSQNKTNQVANLNVTTTLNKKNTFAPINIDSIELKVRIKPKLFLDFWYGMSFPEYNYIKYKLIGSLKLTQEDGIDDIFYHHQCFFNLTYNTNGDDQQFFVLPSFDSSGLISITLLDTINPHIYKNVTYTLLKPNYYDDIILLYTQKYGKPKSGIRKNVDLHSWDYIDNKPLFVDCKFYQFENEASDLFVEISLINGESYNGFLENNDIFHGFKIKYMRLSFYRGIMNTLKKKEGKITSEINNKQEEKYSQAKELI